MESTARELTLDSFEEAMQNLRVAGIDFEEVDETPPGGTDPPDKREPSPARRDGSDEDAANASTPSVTETSDEKRRVGVGEWRRALLRAELGATAQHVGLVLAEYMDRDGSGAFPTQETLAAACGRTDRTVRDALHDLKAAGYLRVRRTGRASRYLATVPTGGEVIEFPRTAPGFRSEPVQVSDQSGSLDPPTQPSTQPSTQEHASPSLTEDQELYQAMHRLAEASGARSPKAWVAKVFGEDIRPIILERGRDAALAEVERRTRERRESNRRRAASTHRYPESEGHGDTGEVTINW